MGSRELLLDVAVEAPEAANLFRKSQHASRNSESLPFQSGTLWEQNYGVGGFLSELISRSKDCSSGLSPCRNLGSFRAACWVAGLIFRSMARCRLITCLLANGMACHLGSNVFRTNCRCSGVIPSRACSASRNFCFCSGDRLFHRSRFRRICSCRAGGKFWNR